MENNVDVLKSNFLYVYYDIKSKQISNIISTILFIGLVILSVWQKKNFAMRNNYDNIIIQSVVFYIVYLRILLVGLRTPYDLIEREVNVKKLYSKETLIMRGCSITIYLRICTKLLVSFCIQIITLVVLEIGMGIIYDIYNYLILGFYILVGIFITSVIGYFVAILSIYLDLRRELVLLIEIIVMILLLQIKDYYYLIPHSILRSDINAILTTDIVFAQISTLNFRNCLYYLVCLFIAIILSFVLLNLMGYLYRIRPNGKGCMSNDTHKESN